jgi:hypothetical protein
MIWSGPVAIPQPWDYRQARIVASLHGKPISDLGAIFQRGMAGPRGGGE